MKKKILIMMSLLLVTAMAYAVPAKRGNWKTIKLTDGTEVRVQLLGDEHGHWWQSETGECYVLDSNETFKAANMTELQQRASARRANVAAKREVQAKKFMAPKKTNSIFTGVKKGLIILVEFGGSGSNYKFSTNKYANGDVKAFFQRFANEENFVTGNYHGSVRDYFHAQSDSVFDLQFDIVGPVTVSRNSAYYAGSDGAARATEMVSEACQLVADSVDFADYDWDENGVVDQVFILYAGLGQADGGGSSTIWPHMYWLSAENRQLTIDGVLVDTYACSCELNGSSNVTGIGTVCHEFSHCLGYPDMYDVNYGGNYGMSDWDLMDSGSYNGNGYCPAGYTSWERMIAGWVDPIELVSDTVVSGMAPINDRGESFIIYNKGNKNEYYMLENRQQTNWDSYIPNSGMLILHVDYDSTMFANNIVNTTGRIYVGGGQYVTNDHQRLTVIPANNSTYSWTEYGMTYPYGLNDSLTNTSKPSAMVYNENLDGSKLMNIRVTKIKKYNDGTMSFVFGNIPMEIDTTEINTTYLFRETFNKCAGTGGNDGKWGGSIASSKFIPDMDGWTANVKFGGNKCARFGRSTAAGVATTPEFTVNGLTTFSFMAAPWEGDGTDLTLSVEGEDITIEPTSFTLTEGEWTTCTATITGTGKVKVTFTPETRFFLDEVKAKEEETTGIVAIGNEKRVTDGRIYSIDGRYVGNDFNLLRHGIYIVNGKKVVK